MDLSFSFVGIPMEHRLMNAAGTVKTVEEVKTLANSASAAIMVGSITLAEKPGNSGNVFWKGQMFSINALGLPNRGAEFYKDVLPEMVTIAQDAGKPLFVSVAGMTVEEFAILAELVMLSGADLIELNLGCPNIWEDKTQKPIVCYDLEYVEEVLEKVTERIGHGAIVSLKLSPFFDSAAREKFAKLINASPLVKAITTTNTLPNAVVYEGKNRFISKDAKGFGGMSGPPMKPVGIGQVIMWRALLDRRIPIIGVGGVDRGLDIWEYLLSEASLVQVATALLERGPDVFSSMLFEFLALEEQYS